MCIRDSRRLRTSAADDAGPDRRPRRRRLLARGKARLHLGRCLLYTSDAAGERSSVDLGGRRIIKKKNTGELSTDLANLANT